MATFLVFTAFFYSGATCQGEDVLMHNSATVGTNVRQCDRWCCGHV